MQHIAVLIVSYNTRDLLRQCLQSVQDALLPPGWERTIVVVDNSSRDGSAGMVAAEFPDVQLLASPANLGFTGGNNLGLHSLGFDVACPAVYPDTPPAAAASPPDAVLLLNPDAMLHSDTLAALVKALDTLPQAAVCGAHLRYADGSFQHGAFQFPGLMQIALDFFPLSGIRGAGILQARLHNSRLNGRYPATLWQNPEPFAVDFVLGAAMCVRGRAIAQIGGLDDDYFMYCEEMDWCLRFAQAGWGIYAAPAAFVTHHEAQSSRQVRWEAYTRMWRSRFRFYTKFARHYPPGFIHAVRGLVRFAMALRRRQARRRFGAGLTTGEAAAQELAAYAAVARL